MSNEQENFDQLRLLLSVKRHEQPPPGYFDRLPREIMARIEAGEATASVSISERLGWDAPWLQRLWSVLETKPVVAGTLGVAVSGLLLVGVAFNMSPEAQPIAGLPIHQGLATRDSEASLYKVDTGAMPGLANAAMFAATGSVVSLTPQLLIPEAGQPYAMPIPNVYH